MFKHLTMSKGSNLTIDKLFVTELVYVVTDQPADKIMNITTALYFRHMDDSVNCVHSICQNGHAITFDRTNTCQ